MVPGKRFALSLMWLSLLLLAAPARAGWLEVTDAATGQPLKNAVVEVYSTPAPASENSAPYQIVQRQAAFIPHVLVVPVGSQVSFPNRDTTRHQVYSFSPPRTFSLDLYLHETPPPVTFDKPGVEVLGCNIHDAMQAFIVVSAAPFTATTGATGRVDLSTLSPGMHRLRIWHARLEDTHQQWWEGRIGAGSERRVALTLRASQAVPDKLSALARRFQQALHDGAVP